MLTIIQTLNEASAETILGNITNRIEQEVGLESGGSPTGAWVSGLLTSLDVPDSKPMRLLRAYKNGSFDPESKEYKDGKRTELALKILASNGIVSQNDNGNYTVAPRANKIARDKLSKFKQAASSYVHDSNEKKNLQSQFRNAESSVDSEWYNSLDDNKKKLVDIYSQLNSIDFAYLKRIADLKNEKKSYVDLIKTNDFTGSEIVTRLKSVGIVKNDDKIDFNLVKELRSFIFQPENFSKVRNFNKNIQRDNKKITADAALARNELNRKFDPNSGKQSSVSSKASDIISRMTDDAKHNLLTLKKTGKLLPSQMQELKRYGIIDDSNHLSELGEVVSAALKINFDLNSFKSSDLRDRDIRLQTKKDRAVDRINHFSKNR